MNDSAPSFTISYKNRIVPRGNKQPIKNIENSSCTYEKNMQTQKPSKLYLETVTKKCPDITFLQKGGYNPKHKSKEQNPRCLINNYREIKEDLVMALAIPGRNGETVRVRFRGLTDEEKWNIIANKVGNLIHERLEELVEELADEAVALVEAEVDKYFRSDDDERWLDSPILRPYYEDPYEKYSKERSEESIAELIREMSDEEIKQAMAEIKEEGFEFPGLLDTEDEPEDETEDETEDRSGWDGWDADEEQIDNEMESDSWEELWKRAGIK